MDRKPDPTLTRYRDLRRAGATSIAFFIPLILAAAYLNAGPTCCGGTCPEPPPPDFRVSKSTAGASADAESTDGSVSPQGNDIAFSSDADNLDPAAASISGPHVFVHNISTKATDWVSLAALGEPDAIGSGSPVLSEYGQFIAFEQQFFAIPPTRAIIFRDLDAVTPSFETIVSTGTTPVSHLTMSGDGRYLAFATTAALLPEDTDALSDIYLTDRQTGALSLYSTGSAGAGAALRPELSRDGQTIAFEVQGGSGTVVRDLEGVQFEVFLGGDRPSISDDGRLVALRDWWPGTDRIFVDGLLWGPLEEVSIDSSGIPTTGDCGNPLISGNGRYVAFSCVEAMTDHGALNQVYVRDLVEETTKLASISEAGVPANSTDSKPVGIPTNGAGVIIESSADNLGNVPGGFPQVFRIPISYWSEGGSTCSADDTTCDGIDDDCDGQTDEDYVSQATSCGMGACAATGVTSCVSGVEQNSCVPFNGTPEGAICDGIDDDCDGSIDEDFVDIPSNCGFGPCESTGLLTCQSGVVVDTCTPGAPGATDDTTCDGIDDDCDGTVDEDCCPTMTCEELGLDCDGFEHCGQSLDCGTCAGEEVCGGGGTPNVCSVQLPPDPETVAPSGPTGSGSFLDSLAFLTEASPPVQIEVQPGALEPNRAGLVRGRVVDHSGLPVPAIEVTVVGDASLGRTLTRADGEYDLLVNGGGRVTLDFDSDDYLPVQRTVDVPWAEALELPDIVMSVQSDVYDDVEFPLTNSAQVVAGRTYQDDDGPRQVVGFIPQWTDVEVTVDGQSVPLPNNSGRLRITEYTVGSEGVKAMPAVLPENSLYTFAVDISLDEVGPRARVEFTETTYFYVDNFLELPVGGWVPSGYYDYEKADWIAETDGLVMKVVGVTPEGLAEIDATYHDPQDPLPNDPTGDLPLDAQGLADLDLTDDERQRLASLYWNDQTQEGATFWRMPINHLSPWDWNHAGFRKDPPPAWGADSDDSVDLDCDERQGSIISCQQRSLAEEVPVAGTPFSLRYDSNRSSANVTVDRTVVIDLPDQYPQEALSMVFRASVLGRTIVDEELPLAQDTKTVQWDGLDAFGREWLGAATLEYTISYRYQETYRMALNRTITGLQARSSFGGQICNCNSDPCCVCGAAVPPVISPAARAQSATGFSFTRSVVLGSGGGTGFDLGGWTLSHYHAYDPESRLLIRGDGRLVATASRSDAPSVAAGRKSDGIEGNDVASDVAEFSDISDPKNIAAGPDGAVYFTAGAPDGSPPVTAVWKLTWQGGVAPIFVDDQTQGNVTCESSGIEDLAVGPDGVVYLACKTAGIVSLTEGPGGSWGAAQAFGSDPYGEPTSWTDGTSLLQGGIDVRSLAFREDGRLLFTARQNLGYGFGQLNYGVSDRTYELIEVLPDGRGRVLQPVGQDAQGDPVVVSVGSRIAPSANNSVVTYTGGRVVQIFASEVATTLMGSSGTGVGFDWESTETHRADESGNFFSDIASSSDGHIYLAFDRDNCNAHKLYQISRSGEIRRVSLEGLPQDYEFTIGSCIQTAIDSGGGGLLSRLAVGPEGLLYATSGTSLDRVYSFGGAGGVSTDGTLFEVVSDDGSEVYAFTSDGLHRVTRDAETGDELFVFWQDDQGRLERIDDRSQRSVRILRPDASTIQIVAPAGPGGTAADEQATTLVLNAEGYLEQITDPRNAIWSFDYHPTATHGGGLLASMWDPRANEAGLRSGPSYDFEYERFDSTDETTRWLLRLDTDPVTGTQELAAEQLYSESNSQVRADALFPVMGTWCDGSEYVRGYKIGKTTTRITHETSLGRQTRYDTSLSTGSPRSYRLTKAKGGAISTTRTDPNQWFVARTQPNSENEGGVSWPDGSLGYTLTAHPRLGGGAMVPETSTLVYDEKTQPAADARPELRQDVTVSFDPNNDFDPVAGFPTPTVERIYTEVVPTNPASGSSRQSWVEFTSTPEPKITMTSAEGRTSMYVLDNKSRVVRVELPGQVPTTYVYDGQEAGFLDRAERQKGVELRKTEFGYDKRGYVSSVKNKVSDAVTDEVTMVNDPVGFASQTTVEPSILTVGAVPDITGALSGLTPQDKPQHQLSYTPLGQLSQYASPAGTVSSDGTCPAGTQCWRYTLDRELDEIVLSDGSKIDYVYDGDGATGNLTSIVERDDLGQQVGGATTFGYDLGRRTSATAPDEGTMTFAWQSTLPIRTSWEGTSKAKDGATTVWSGPLNGSVERFYNDFLEVSELHVSGAGHVTEMKLVRDKDGLVEQIQDTGGSTSAWATLSLSRSSLDGHVEEAQLQKVTTDQVLDISATVPGFGDLVSQRACLNDADNEPCDVTSSFLYESFYNEYDDRGRIKRWTESLEGQAPSTREFTYDEAGRLTKVVDVDSGQTLEEYAYDGNGNRTKAYSVYVGFPGAALDTSVAAGTLGCTGGVAANDEDQLCTYDGLDYTYNGRGQLTSRSDGTTYRYDRLGRLKHVQVGGTDIHYVHDALGRRIGKVKNGNLEKGWLYSDALNPIAQLDSSGNVEATFLYGTRAHVPDAMVMTDGTVYRLITDHLGSVRLVVNAETGEVVQRMDYDAFGRVLSDTNPGFQPFGFAGGLYDDDTGLVRFGVRDYDAHAGKWTAKDPILFDGESTNLYSYVSSDPLNLVDPSGLCPNKWIEFLLDIGLGFLGYWEGLGIAAAHLAALEGWLGEDTQTYAEDVNNVLGAGALVVQENPGRAATELAHHFLDRPGRVVGRAAASGAVSLISPPPVSASVWLISSYGQAVGAAQRGDSLVRGFWFGY